MLREVGRDRDQLCEAALEVEQLHCGVLFRRGDEAGGLVQELNGLGDVWLPLRYLAARQPRAVSYSQITSPNRRRFTQPLTQLLVHG